MPRQVHTHSSVRNAFTLIELLVVVAIIIVLIAILIPALSRAMEAAQTAKCLTNCKNFATALNVYSTDHKGGLMPYANDHKQMGPNGKPTQNAWSYEWHIAPYVGEPDWPAFPADYPAGNLLADDEWVEDQYSDNNPGVGEPGEISVPDSERPNLQINPLKVMQCPVADVVEEPWREGVSDAGTSTRNWTKYDQIQGSYAINGWLLTESVYNKLPPGDGGFYRMSKTSADVPAYGDATYHNAWPFEYRPNEGDYSDAPPFNYRNPNLHPTTWRYTLSRHSGGVNISYTDGSAETIRIGDIWYKKWHMNSSPSVNTANLNNAERAEIERLRR